MGEILGSAQLQANLGQRVQMRYRDFYQALIQPWKLASLALGLGLLIAGAQYYRFSDWDVGISVIMALLTYLTAPFAVRTILRRNWKALPLALLLAWLTIDGSYMLYHTALGHQTLRDANVLASTPLYLMMGCIWLWNGSLRELISSTLAVIHPKRPPSPESVD